jgi:iron(II)-dependent oxidoreductase
MLETARAADLGDLMRDARRRTFEIVRDLSDAQMRVPLLPIINPILWEMGHIAYFAEFWTLRNLHRRPPIISNADLLYDSAKIPHDDRWSLPLPDRSQTVAFMNAELANVLELLRKVPQPADAFYFHRLAVHHEDMHGEALIYTLQTLGYAQPGLGGKREVSAAGPLLGDAHIPAGEYDVGSRPDDGFVFDNEKWAQRVALGDYHIARAPVTNVEFAQFVADGGYRRAEFWSDEGWAWRKIADASHPVYWLPRSDGGWQLRHFDTMIDLAPNQPVAHVNWFEAQAYCAWSGRRLPSEAEWEVAASGHDRLRYPWGNDPPDAARANLDCAACDFCDVAAFESGDSPFGCRQMIGNVWEWTATDFAPYPGFTPDPYKEYSAPWFGTHKVLRGGAWSTRARLITNRWRNFYMPHRRDIITGFRTCKRAG